VDFFLPPMSMGGRVLPSPGGACRESRESRESFAARGLDVKSLASSSSEIHGCLENEAVNFPGFPVFPGH
jgi:hypothetical protein